LIDFEYDPAKQLYIEAENKMMIKQYDSSLINFYNIYESYPSSPLAPKALYASGWILENELKLFDSAAVVYDTITVKYPQSQYASLIRTKIITYKQEQDRLKRIIEDSLRVIKRTADSLAAADSVKFRLSEGKVGSDTTRMFEELSDSLVTDSLNIPGVRNYIEEGNRNIERNIKNNIKNNASEDSLFKEHNFQIDSLTRSGNREIDTTDMRINESDIDTLNSKGPEP
jgi:hypothetical protein